MKISRWMLVAGTAAIVLAIALAGSFGASKAPAAKAAPYRTALVSDVGTFNDNGFNKLQLVGLKKETGLIHGKYYALESHVSADYTPNYNTAVNVDKAQIVVAAGFLLGDTMNTWSKAHPKTKFAITDDSAAYVGKRKNEEGITYATQEGGCLVGVLAAEYAASKGTKVIGVVGGIKIPPVDSYIAGYEFCAKKAVKGTTIVVQYSNDFVDQSKCSTLAANEINIQHAQVVFQVAGLCGDGALTQAAIAGQDGHRRGCRRVQPRQRQGTHPHECPQEDGRRRRARDQRRVPQHVARRQGHPLEPQEQRRRRRQDEPGREVQLEEPDEQVQGADHRQDPQASGGLQGQLLS